MRGKVPQEWRLVSQAHAGNGLAVLPDFQYHLDYIVNMALGVDAARDGETDQVHLSGGGEHQRADFDGADSAFEVEFGGKSYSRELIGRNVRQEGAGVEVNRVAAGRLDDGHSLRRDVITQICGRGDAVAQVVFFERFLHANGNGFQIAAG